MHSGGVAAGVYRQPTIPQANGSGTVSSPSRRPRKRERPPNYGAQLLSATENQTLFSLLGHDCISLAAGVVQLLKADPDNPRFWTKVHVGVISLVKDYEKRAYFLRLYEIFKKQFTWEQMLYKNFRVSSAATCPNLLSFEGDECVYGLNFSSREEAINFKHHLDKRYEQEQRSLVKDQRLMWTAFGGHSIRRRRGVTSESDLNNLWLQNETLICRSPLSSVHSEYAHWPGAVQIGYDRLYFGNTFPANYFCNNESHHYGDELLLYNYTPPHDVYYFDSGPESQIRCPTPDYSPSESPSQECSRLSVDSLFGGTCRVNNGRADEVETDSGSSGYASSSLSQKWEHCPPPINKSTHRKHRCCCSDCTHLYIASEQLESQIDARRNMLAGKSICSRQESIPAIHSDERNSRVKAVTFSEPLSTDVHPSVESSSPANYGSFRRRATQILSPARKWLSIPLRIEHTSLIGHLPELQQRVKATLEAIMSHEISSELWKTAKGSGSSSTSVKSEDVTASNTVTAGGLFHSLSEVDISSRRSSMMSTAFDEESSKTDVRKRPPLPPNPPSRCRILKYSNVSAQRFSGESSSMCSSSIDKRVLEGKLQAQKGSRSGTNGVSGAVTTLQAGGHHYPSLQNRTGITSMGAIPNVGGQLANLVSSTRNKKKSTKKDKKTRIRKEDISNPTNFLHKVHVGWDQDGGFSQETYDGEPMDESILTLLRAAGQNPDRMTKEDLDFSYRFITDYQKTTQSPVVPPPPPPLIQQNTQRQYHPSQATQNATSPPPPPPPPIRREASLTSTPPSRPPQRPPAVSRPLARPLPTPPSLSSGSSYRPNDAPPPPPPPNFAVGDSSMPPPPPPPPPPTQTGGVPPPPPPPPPPIGPAPTLPPPATGGRANLLNEIHAGIALRPVSTNAQNDNNNVGSREDVMAQIRQGANLKPVDKAAIENRKSSPNITDVGGIAGALARALEERRRNMHNSDDSEEEDAENNDSEWETD